MVSTRRSFLLATAGLVLLAQSPLWAVERDSPSAARAQLGQLEKRFGGRIRVFALNTADGSGLSYRADERFPVCSTFKVLAAAALLRKSGRVPGLMQQRIKYQQGNLVSHSPITEKHVSGGMTVAELCAAAIQYSDNTAGNLMLRMLGGPSALTAFSRSIGDSQFRLDRWETALNTAIPGDSRDTSTPRAMALNLERLVLGDALKSQQRKQLREWMLGNTTGTKRIKAGLPANWLIGDKTGGGDYGTANDVGVLWPPHRKPIIVAIYTTQPKKDATAQNEVIADVARIVVKWVG
ncbi:class A beta-lactamase [bacterium]|nr:MAG: class A beta-lactamase [bacterium]